MASFKAPPAVGQAWGPVPSVVVVVIVMVDVVAAAVAVVVVTVSPATAASLSSPWEGGGWNAEGRIPNLALVL